MVRDAGPNFHRKADSGLERVFDRFSEEVVFIAIDRTSGEIDDTFRREGIVNFQNNLGEDISVVYDERFSARIKVKRERIPDEIVTNNEADKPDQIYVPRLGVYFQFEGEAVQNLFNTLNAIPLEQPTVTID